jgi:hypothetical protein
MSLKIISIHFICLKFDGLNLRNIRAFIIPQFVSIVIQLVDRLIKFLIDEFTSKLMEKLKTGIIAYFSC